MQRNTILQGDAWHLARQLPDESINCIVTSPPYFGLRDYGIEGQMGLEATPEQYVSRLVALFAVLRPALRDDGTVWLNLGDSYANDNKWGGSTGGKHASGLHGESGIGRGKVHTGLKPKDLIGIPWRVAFALQADGWYLRSEIIWHKRAPMPESVTDRPTKAHEQVFLLTKSPRYYYDAEAIAEQSASEWTYDQDRRIQRVVASGGALSGGTGNGVSGGTTRNKRSVWTLGPETYRGAHFAVMPTKLVEPCILAGCPHKVCSECGAPWVRVVEREVIRQGDTDNALQHTAQPKGIRHGLGQSTLRSDLATTTTGFEPTCVCDADTRPGMVLDPFLGSGTVAAVAKRLGRDWLGFELNPEYIELAYKRIDGAPQPLFAMT